MNQKSIKIQRVESILSELIPEALNTLSDEMLRGLCIVGVDCSRGKYDAKVFIDNSLYSKDEQEYILERLQKVRKVIENYCLQAEGWYRCPNLRFVFDDSLQKQQRMDELFNKISMELKNSAKQ